MPVAYKGSEPYIFVSYAHKDSELVVPIIRAMQEQGYRIWFDQGIEAGTEWSNNIAAHLQGCTVFLFFASCNSAKSENCLDEIAFAKSHQKTSLMVFLQEDVVLPSGTEMQTARFQRMYRTRHPSLDSFIGKICEASILDICREIPAEPEQEEPVVQHRDEPIKKPEPADVIPDEEDDETEEEFDETPEEKKKRKSLGRMVTLVSVLLELSYCLLGPRAIEMIYTWTENGWLRFLLAILPHVLIAVIIRVIAVKSGAKLSDDQITNIFGFALVSWMVSTVLAVIIGVFYIPLEINGFLKFLLSLGLNIVPALVSVIIYFTITDISAGLKAKKK